MLRGKLAITGLENVKSKDQALQANLAAKQLTELLLWWSSYGNRRSSPEVQSDVLEGLWCRAMAQVDTSRRITRMATSAATSLAFAILLA
jgi:hypothetical protein